MSLGDLLPPREVGYGEEVRFATGSRLTYPDFSVEFLGKSRDLPITSWRFAIRTEAGAVEVACVTGGVREGARFNARGRTFSLDLLQIGSEDWWTLAIAPVQTE